MIAPPHEKGPNLANGGPETDDDTFTRLSIAQPAKPEGAT